MLATDFPFYSIQMPLNVFDSQFRSFEQQVLPELTRRGIAPLGMKPMRGHGDSILKGAMRLPVAVTITGMEKPEVLQQNLRIARGFQAMTASEMQNVRDRVKVYAADGRFELYKLSLKFDNPEARMAHGFPLDMTSVEVKEMMGATENTGRPWAAATWGRPKI